MKYPFSIKNIWWKYLPKSINFMRWLTVTITFSIWNLRQSSGLGSVTEKSWKIYFTILLVFFRKNILWMAACNANYNIFARCNMFGQTWFTSGKYFFSKCEQICSFLGIWSHLLKKSLMENFIFCAVWELLGKYQNWVGA